MAKAIYTSYTSLSFIFTAVSKFYYEYQNNVHLMLCHVFFLAPRVQIRIVLLMFALISR